MEETNKNVHLCECIERRRLTVPLVDTVINEECILLCLLVFRETLRPNKNLNRT